MKEQWTIIEEDKEDKVFILEVEEDKEHECFECGREWTRSNGRGCPYGDPTCFLCEKHEHNDCDYPEGVKKND